MGSLRPVSTLHAIIATKLTAVKGITAVEDGIDVDMEDGESDSPQVLVVLAQHKAQNLPSS